MFNKTVKCIRDISIILMIGLFAIVFLGASVEAQEIPDFLKVPTVSRPDVKPEYTIRVGHVDLTDHWSGRKSYAATIMFKSIVEGETNGKVQVQEFPAQELGNATSMLAATQLRTLEMNMCGDSSLTGFFPANDILSIPYIFSSQAVAHKVITGPFGDKLSKAILEETGMRVLGWGGLGYRYFISNKPLKSVDDFKGIKVRVMESTLQMKMIEALGAIPTPISFSELYTALSQGVTDATDTAAYSVPGRKFYEVTDYMYISAHLYTFQAILINEEFFQSLPEEYQVVILRAGKEAAQLHRSISAMTDYMAVDKILSENLMEIYFPSIEEKAQLQALMQKPIMELLRRKLGIDETDMWLRELFSAVRDAEIEIYGKGITEFPNL